MPGYAFTRLSCRAHHPTALCSTNGFSCLQIMTPLRDVTNVTAAAGKKSKSDKLGQVDHATLNYPPFRRNLYTEASDLSSMSEEKEADYQSQLDDITVRGRNVPRPVRNWFQCGLSRQILKVLQKTASTSPCPSRSVS